MEKSRHNYSDQVAERRWAGLTPAQWRRAREAGHYCRAGQLGAVVFSMHDGFHCACGRWSVPHDGGVMSDVRHGCARWGDHVRDALAGGETAP